MSVLNEVSNELIMFNKNELKSFINNHVRDFYGELIEILWISQDLDDPSVLRFYPEGLYQSCEELLNTISPYEYNLILDMYSEKVGKLSELKWRIKHLGYSEYLIAKEALATILLKEYQNIKEWQLLYGVEHKFAIDLVEKPEKCLNVLLEGLQEDEYIPINQMADLYGDCIANSIEAPASLYDVFAYMESRWEEDKKQNSLLSNEPVFTPDMIVYEAVVSRWKAYTDLIQAGHKIVTPMVLDNLYKKYDIGVLTDEFIHELKAEALVELLYMEYINSPSNIAKLLPISNKYFSMHRIWIEEIQYLNVSFSIPGVCKGEREVREVFNHKYLFPSLHDDHAINELLFQIVTDIKVTLAGQEKERRNGLDAIEGVYARKNHATHGLKLQDKLLSLGMERATELATAQSIYVIKQALKYCDKPVLSNSFGADSIFTYHLISKVTNTVSSVYINTGVEYGTEIVEVKKRFLEHYKVPKENIIMLRPDKTYWDVQKKYGWNFSRKGDRRKNKKNKVNRVSEACCAALKHFPMENFIQSSNSNCSFTGLRGDESRARELAGKRDGAFYYAKSWRLFKANPIIFWSNIMVWYVIKRDNIPYAKIYDMVLYEKDQDGNDIEDKCKYLPRMGCWCCSLTAKNGYFQWLQEFKPKQYEFLMRRKGLGELLYRLHMNLPVEFTEKGGVTLPKSNDIKEVSTEKKQISFFDTMEDTFFESVEVPKDFDMDQVFWWLENRPCQLENVLKTKV